MTTRFSKGDVGNWIVITECGPWYERLLAAIVTWITKPRILNHLLYHVYRTVTAYKRDNGVYVVTSIESTVPITVIRDSDKWEC